MKLGENDRERESHAHTHAASFRSSDGLFALQERNRANDELTLLLLFIAMTRDSSRAELSSSSPFLDTTSLALSSGAIIEKDKE